ncbi:Actin-related protein 2/3 complex subunit 1 [Smittium mucronatum]|uniref:Arp2/3 complex 41 kDa subunit n=1 Tax=Smittium mucronatum TaxID=133383 RepID=A0A1R0GPI7_9FUNG|nr:Actin-related protein 2/3 complex subunit 1 [Smittium mucronatum]
MCGEYESEFSGWVHDVSFSPDGNQLAFVAHDSTLTIIDPASSSATSILSKDLPYNHILWMESDKIIVSGQDSIPSLYQLTGNGWELKSAFKKTKTSSRDSSSGNDSPVMRSSAFNMFKSMDTRKSTSFNNDEETSSSSVDQSPISDLRFVVDGGVSRFSSSCFDGKIKVWEVVSN